MMTNAFKIPSLLLVVSLLGCQQSKSGHCASTQAQLSGSNPGQNFVGQPPAGGYIQFGDKACTATFVLDSASDKELRVTTYTARHCSREDLADNPTVNLSVYLPSKSPESAGYIKNVPAKYEFFERRKTFLADVAKLNNRAANTLAQQSTVINGMIDYSSEPVDPDTPMDQRESNVYRNCEVDKAKRESVQATCWSAVDLTVENIRVSLADVGAARFSQLRNYLQQRKPTKDQAATIAPWTQRLKGLSGATRLFSYGQHLGSFLNQNVCQMLAKDDPMYEACAVRPQLLKLVETHLVEQDVDGQTKSILKAMDDMGLGITSPYLRGEAGTSNSIDLRTLFVMKFPERVNKTFVQHYLDIEKLFGIRTGNISSFGKDLALAANATFTQNGQKTAMFGLIDPSVLKGTAPSLVSRFRSSTVLQLELPKSQSNLLFNSTDSGTFITFNGMVPLLVLHAVDGDRVSGGASILALPEAPPEESNVSARNPAAARGRTVAARPAQGNVGTGVELRDPSAVINAGDSASFCN